MGCQPLFRLRGSIIINTDLSNGARTLAPIIMSVATSSTIRVIARSKTHLRHCSFVAKLW